MPFRVVSAPVIFQRTVDVVLQGPPKVICYIDDILLIGSNDEEHIKNLEEILKCLQQHGVQLKADTCKCSSCKILLNTLGIILTKKVYIPPLRTWRLFREHILLVIYRNYTPFWDLSISMVNSYLICIVSTILQPLNQLLQNGRHWGWTPACA